MNSISYYFLWHPVLKGPASKLLFQFLRPVFCSSLKVESESYHLQAPSNLESLYELPEDVLFLFSWDGRHFPPYLLSSCGFRASLQQDAAQSVLRPFFAQSLVCGKPSLNIWKLNKLKWTLTVADNFNCSALLGTRGEDFPASFVATGPCCYQWSRRGPDVCPFRSGPSRPFTCISPHSRSFCWRMLVGLRSKHLRILRSRRGSEGSCWYQAPVWGWTPWVLLLVSLDYLKSDASNFALLLYRECHILGTISVSSFPFLRMRDFQELQHLSGYRRYFYNVDLKNFPGGPAAKTLYSQDSGPDFNP